MFLKRIIVRAVAAYRDDMHLQLAHASLTHLYTNALPQIYEHADSISTYAHVCIHLYIISASHAAAFGPIFSYDKY